MDRVRDFVAALPRFLVFLYGMLFAYLALLAHADSQELGYSTEFLMASAMGSTATVSALLCHVIGLRHPFVLALLRMLFPLALISFVWGVILDAIEPDDYSLVVTGVDWIIQTIPVLLFVLPAYTVYFAYAYPSPQRASSDART